MNRRQESAVTLQIHIGRLVLDQRVATGPRGALGESIQTELASLLSNGEPVNAHAQTSPSLAGSIAASIANRVTHG